MKKLTNWAGTICMFVGLIPVFLLLVGALEMAAASVSTQLGIDASWFSIKGNMWVRMMELAYAGDLRIIASFVFVFIGLALMILSDNMRHPTNTSRKRII